MEEDRNMLVPEWSVNLDNETIRLYDLEPLRVKMGNYHRALVLQK